MVNKIKSLSLRFAYKPENRQRTVAIGLGAIVVIATIAFVAILNNEMFTPGYSQPFIDWLHTSGGKAFIAGYLALLILLILLSVSKTSKLINKGFKKVTSPLSSKLAFSYSTDSITKIKKRITYLVWVIILLTPFVLYTFVNQKYAKAGWWDDNWHYRIRSTITDPGSGLSDFQVAITLDTSSLISSGKMQSDCKDIRVYDYSLQKLQTYWVQNCNTSTTKIWMKQSFSANEAKVFWVYYGNLSTAYSQEADGNDIFNFFDDFNDNNIDTNKWTKVEQSGLTVAETNQEIKFGGTKTTTDWTNASSITTNQTFTNPFIAEVKAKLISTTPGQYRTFFRFPTPEAKMHFFGNSGSQYDIYGYTPSETELVNQITLGAWYNFKIVADGTNYQYYVNDNYEGQRSSSSNSTLELRDTVYNSGQGHDTRFDNVFVRKYASTEPTVNNGSEETGPGPLAHWKFNEGYGQTAHDSTFGQYDATLGSTSGSDTNDPTWLTEDDCVSGMCLSFDGIDNYVNPNNQLLTGTKYSISAWFKTPTVEQEMEIYSQRSSTDDDSIMGQLYLVGSKIGFITRADNGGNSALAQEPTPLQNNAWYHVVGVRDGANVYIYLNGELVGSDNDAGGTITTNVSDIGRANGGGTPGGYFNGSIDEVKIYPYARSAEEIKTDYMGASSSGSSAVLGQSDDSKLQDGLVTYWKMDEASANTCDDTNDACDSSGFGNHARWEDNATSSGGKFASGVDFDGTNDRVATSSANGVPSPWTKRKSITITNNEASQLTNYQVKLTVTYDSNMQVDFDDLRFTNSTGSDLDYWIESYTESSTATVWVEVDTLPASVDTVIYMYYGNGSITNASNGSNTFQLFDGFDEDLSYTKVGAGNGTYSIASSIITATQTTAGSGLDHGYQISSSFAVTSGQHVVRASFEPSNLQELHGISFCTLDTGRFYKFAGTQAWGLTPEQNYSGTGLQVVYAKLNDFSCTGYVAITQDDDAGATAESKYDWLLIRQYTTNEPTPVINSEESSYAYGGSDTLNISVSAWVKADTLGATDRVITSRNNSANYSWAIYNDSSNPGKLAFTSDGDTNTGISNTTLSTGKWYHVAMASNNNTTRLYINGVLDKEIANSGYLGGTGNISVGADPDGTDGWDGKIDEVRIYNRTLPANEVTQLYKWAPAPLLHYKFDEGTGTSSVYDSSGNGNNGAMNGSMTEDDWVKGQMGSALDLDGSDDSIDLGTPSDLNFSGDITISAWVKFDDVTKNGWVLEKESDYWLWWSGNNDWSKGTSNIVFGGYCGGEINPSFSATNGVWYHIAGTISNNSATVYVNGKLIGTGTGVICSGSANTDIGFRRSGAPGSGYHYLNGQIDELKVYSYARTPEQVVEDMNAGHPAPGSPVGSPVMHLRFDEGYGDTAYDSSPQGNNGDLNGTCPGGANCPSWSNSGKNGKALSFSGGDYLTVVDDSSLDIAGGNWTVSMWLNVNSWANDQMLLQKGNWNTSGYYINLYNDTGDSRLYISSYAGESLRQAYTAQSPFSTGVWTHVVFTRNGSEGKIYINSKNATVSSSTFVDASPQVMDLYIGQYTSGTQPFGGLMDEIKMYNFAFSEAQIAQEYNLGKSVVWGATSTDSSGNADRSAEGKYCVPGDSTSCSAPVAEWKFDEGQNTSAFDTSGGNNTGTLTSGPLWKSLGECKDGKCLYFDGSDDQVTVPSYFNLSNINLSISTWVYIYDTSESGSFVKIGSEDAGDNDGYAIGVGGSGYEYDDEGNDLILLYEGVRWIDTNTTIGTGWHHVTMTINGSGVPSAYIDGKFIGSYSGTNANAPEAGDSTKIGGYTSSGPSNRFGNYLLDEVHVYNYTLSPAQVAWNFNQGKPLGHWKLNECQGLTAYDAGTGGKNMTITIGGSGSNTTAGTCSSGTGTEAWNNGTTGKRNASLDFDGNDDYAITAANAIDETSIWSVSTWVKIDTLPTSPNRSAIAGHANAGTGASQWSTTLGIDGNGKTIGYFWDGSANYTTGLTTLSTGQWYHLVFIANTDSDNYFVYVNGKDDTASGPGVQGGPSTNVNEFAIGFTSSGFSDRFDGQIDEVMLFKYALNQNQIKTLHNEGAVRFNE